MSDTPDAKKPNSESQEVFLEFFTGCSRQLYRYILTVTANYSDADDILQSTSVVLLKKFDEFDPSVGSFYSWACRIAYLEVLNMRRSRRRGTMLSDEVLELISSDAVRRSRELDSREAGLKECIDKLPPAERRLLEDRYFHEYTPKQLACRAGCSVHAIYRSLAKVHGLLRRCVDRSIVAEN